MCVRVFIRLKLDTAEKEEERQIQMLPRIFPMVWSLWFVELTLTHEGMTCSWHYVTQTSTGCVMMPVNHSTRHATTASPGRHILLALMHYSHCFMHKTWGCSWRRDADIVSGLCTTTVQVCSPSCQLSSCCEHSTKQCEQEIYMPDELPSSAS